MKSNFEATLAGFGEKIGLGLSLDRDGRVALAVDDVEIGITYIDGDDDVQLYSVIGAMPDDPPPAFHVVLLGANHEGQMTGGGAIGYALEEQLVTFSKRVPGAWLTPPRFEKLIEEFADMVSAWRENFAALQATAEAEAAAEPPDGGAGDGAWIRM